MSSTTNTAINSRSMNGVITISDGQATLENGDLNCDDIISSSLNTSNINTSLLTCSGKFECNLNGPYTIPISISNLTGLLISYGNVTNSGATDFTNFQSTYTSTQGGFRFFNKSATQTLTNLAIIDNSQTYFSSQLTGCLAESPVNANSVVNKTYVDSNFLDRTNNLTQNINGLKTFTSDTAFNAQTTFNNFTPFSNVITPTAVNHLTRKDYVDSNFLDRTNNLTQNINGLKNFTDDLTALNIYCNTALYFRDINLGLNKALIFHQGDIVYFDTLTVYDNYWKFKCFNTEQVVISQLSSTFNNKLISLAQARFDNFTPTCTVATPTQINHLTRKDYVDNNFLDRTNNLTQNINGLKTFTNDTAFNAQATFNNFTPFSNVITPTAVNHLTRKDYVDNNFLDRTNNLTQNINGLKTFTNDTAFNAQATFNNFTPFSNVITPTAVNHLTRKDYVDNNFLDRTNNLTQNVNGLKTFQNNTNFSASLLARTNLTLYEWDNQTGNTLTLTFPMKQTIALRVSSGTTMSVQLPALTTNERGMVYTFVKLSSNVNITLTTGGLNNIYTLNALGTNTTTNTTLLSADKIMTTLAVGFFGALTYWIEVSPYSTFDRDQNNLLYARLASPNAFTNTNTFNSFLPTSTLTPSLNTELITKIFADQTYINFTSDQTITGTKRFNIIFTGDHSWRDVGSPFSNRVQSYVSGTSLEFVPQFANNSYNFYCKDSVPNQTNPLRINSANTTISNNLISNGQFTCNNFTPICSVASPTANNHLTRKDYVDNNFLDIVNNLTQNINGLKTFTQNATFNAGAVFNTVLPTTTITASSANELVNYTTLTSQGFITSSSILSANNSFTGFNTFTNGLTIRSTLLLKDFTNTQQGTIDLGSAILSISCDVNSGKVQINTHDSGGNSYNRVIINEYEFNLTVPITLFLDYTYYNPFNFTSTRLGYSMSNTGSTNTLTNNVANNSGQINIPAGSWNITYTGTITVITNAITTLTSLEIYVADNLTNDLNIIGINVINYYKISTVPVGQKMRISGSGNYISYTNVNTELNLRLLPLFTAGTGGLNFQGKISATRNA